MKTLSQFVPMLIALGLVCGCLVGDQMTTITIFPDGSAELIVVRSNLRSNQQGNRGAEEVATYQQQFDAQAEGDLTRIREAGGEILAVSWIRKDVPMANFLRARLPDASVLERYWTIGGEDGSSGIITQFRRDGVRRRLTIHIGTAPGAAPSAPSKSADAEQPRQAFANGISESRVAVVQGDIKAACGFTIASDRQSALVNVQEINELLRDGKGTADLYLEWEVK